MKTLYEATTKADGGRSGHITSEDGPLDHNLSVPKSMGGEGGNGTNPEQLFGAAYAACFGGALQSVAKNEGIEIDDDALSVTAIIGFCKDEDGFFLEATLDCYIPGVDLETGEDLVEKAHEACPFSKATRDNITVNLNLLLDE
ncbi:Organic hydroperoxide resistance protein [Winogradskyella psychrotolerans RS-3]|uniref:Organic hydroperoxide resistance protein n=1 Tax=Winogradskyella psychrotolerans RS-3 TaxID=641526 RepID=S7VR86_9FLAO|nr:organic hydroperoxide resistance protein [Winogradskyella psychrotolerans]EPR72521.1 Organic hydroperoxide resistance protein [Winogradskyella psychrotolerans RS-3]